MDKTYKPVTPPVTPGEDDATNRRRSPRFKLDVRVTWVAGDGSTVRGAIGRTSDISESGIGAHLPANLAIGESYELKFALPTSAQPMLVKVVLRNRQSYRYGFEFAALNPAQRDQIKRICQTLSVLHG